MNIKKKSKGSKIIITNLRSVNSAIGMYPVETNNGCNENS
jgi:hypothetical protein